MMSMGFNYYKVIDIDEARRLLVYCAEEYLTAINGDEKVRPYLHNYPFTAKNIEIEIVFRNPDGSKVARDKINIAAADEGKMIYYVDVPEKYLLKPILRETYEQQFPPTIFSV